MARTATLLLLLAVPAAGSGFSVTQMMAGAVSKMISGKKVQDCVGPTCCKQSSCAPGPGMGCDERRGETKCVGSSVLHLKMGKCSCVAGACNDQGICPSAASQPQTPTQGFPSTSGRQANSQQVPGWSRLYSEGAEQAGPVPPEDHTNALALLGVGAASLAVLGATAAVRFGRRARRASPEDSHNLLGQYCEEEHVE
mmetsp:Transcript_115538/g.373292  ORF Transcript_115538/g.373292 Transcript_115538/m.373292 type:complete len:197 (+) Transcript_115538:65-655(+)